MLNYIPMISITQRKPILLVDNLHNKALRVVHRNKTLSVAEILEKEEQLLFGQNQNFK